MTTKKCKNINELVERQENLKSKLGDELVEVLENSKGKYMGRGLMIGSVVGSVGGAFLLSYLGFPEDSTEAIRIGFGAFLGLQQGVNIGAVLGLLYNGHKMKSLVKDHPEKAEYIDDYVGVTNAMTGVRARMPAV